MSQFMKVTAAIIDPVLPDLPWEMLLAEWPTEALVVLSRGPSRHIVRFANLSKRVIAVKKVGESVVHHEYELLRDLLRPGMSCVHLTAAITGRNNVTGERLSSMLVIEHLSYSLPYRVLFSRYMRPETAIRLTGAPTVLLIRLHLLGLYWGDVSPSNALFRRDAGAFVAYLADAETGEPYPEGLTDGKRLYDINVTHTSIIGELMDLQADVLLEPTVDTIEVGDQIVSRHTELWNVFTAKGSFSMDGRWCLRRRAEKLSEMGYDVTGLVMNTGSDGNRITIQLKAVDAGHCHRQVMRLVGLDVQGCQDQRIFNDLEACRAITGCSGNPIEFVAHSWLAEVFEPTIHFAPVETRRKLEPAEIFHETLEHRWYMSEAQDRYVTAQGAVEDYVTMVLFQYRDERAYLKVGDIQEMEAIVIDDDIDGPMPEDDTELTVRDEQTLTDYAANPYGFITGMESEGEQGAHRGPGGASSLTPGDARSANNLASTS